MVRNEFNIIDDYILHQVVPNFSQISPGQVGLVLGCTLLWTVYDKDAGKQIDEMVSSEAKTDLKIGENKIAKVSLLVIGYERILVINEPEGEWGTAQIH